MTIKGPRILDKFLDHLDVTQGTSPDLFPATITGDGWATLDNLLTPTFVNRTYYDLSGYSQDFLTSFFQGVDIQESYPPFGSAACTIVDMVTTEFVDDATLLAAYKYTTGDGDLPGFPRSTFNMEQVIFGRTRTYTSNTTWGDIAIQGESNWGTCAAATADKIHITRVVFSSTTGGSGFSSHIPPCAYVMAIIVAEEDELPFLMRQKRSYELAPVR